MPLDQPPSNAGPLDQLRHHPTQQAYWNSPHQFNVVPPGRRSGKTAVAKRRLKRAALRGTEFDTPRFFAGAPTRDQAKRIFWADLKAMIPRELWRGAPSESELVIRLIHGPEIHVLGMDKPERIEGAGWDGGVLDEYANMKPETWTAHVQPALADRRGWCDFIGVPEGRNHYYDLDRKAIAQMTEHGPESAWGHFHWFSADILPPDVIAQAREDLDELTFQQEYEGSFVVFEGQVYYGFREDRNCGRLSYDPEQPLIVCFDFNVAPGTAVIAQEQRLPNGQDGTGVIGEVWIPRNSNTLMVCRKILEDWKDHRGRVIAHGDATGGAEGSAKLLGTDWDIIRQVMVRGDEGHAGFGDRFSLGVPNANPRVRARINAVNSRLYSLEGAVRLMVDPTKAPHVIRDLEGVRYLEGSAGEIDKKRDPDLTHLSESLGYYIVREFPIERMARGPRRLKGL